MLSAIFKLLCLCILGGLAYDIVQTGSFQNSHTYHYLNEIGGIHHGKAFLKEIKQTFKAVSEWTESNVPVYYNEICLHSKPYIDLGHNLFLLFKSNTVSLIHHTAHYLDKNFPHFQESVNTILTDTVGVAKESLNMISDHLQNYTISAVEYANKMLGSQ